MKSIRNTVIIAVALVLSAAILGLFFYETQKPQRTVKVTGTASQKFEADTVKWNITLRESTTVDAIKDGYARLEQSQHSLVALLREKGIKDEDINIKPINVYKEYDREGFSGYSMEQSIFVISTDMETIEEWALNPVGLVEHGVIIHNSNLEYFYSKIDDLKKDLISEATLNAKERAQKMLENTDLKLGKAISMSAGVFQITEPYSTMVSGGGIYDTSTRKKQISVTAHVVFNLD